MWRDDIRDLVSLTETKMGNYLLGNTIQVGPSPLAAGMHFWSEKGVHECGRNYACMHGTCMNSGNCVHPFKCRRNCTIAHLLGRGFCVALCTEERFEPGTPEWLLVLNGVSLTASVVFFLLYPQLAAKLAAASSKNLLVCDFLLVIRHECGKNQFF